METLKINTHHIDKLVDLIERFYYWNDGVHAWSEKLDTNKLKILLTALAIWNKIHQNDKLYLMDKFSFSLRKSLEGYTDRMTQTENMDDKFLAFIIEIFNEIQIKLRAEYEKEKILFTIREELLQNNNQPISRDHIKNIVEKKFLGKFIYWFPEQEPIYAIIKSNDDQQYRVDIKNNKILYSCWKTLKKMHTFNWNKLFVFEQPSFQSKEKIQAILEEFVTMSNQGTLWEFFIFLKDKLKITYTENITKQFDRFSKKTNMMYIYKKQIEIFSAKVQKILNDDLIGLVEKKILLLNAKGDVNCLGTWKTVEKPKLIKDGWYKWLPAVELFVTDTYDKQHLIVTNGEEKEEFEMDA